MVYAVKDMPDFKAQLEAAGGKLVVIDFFATWYYCHYNYSDHQEGIG